MECQEHELLPPDDWHENYKKLKINFDRLDRQNDVLYRCYIAAKRFSSNTNSPEALRALREAVEQVENFQKGLLNER